MPVEYLVSSGIKKLAKSLNCRISPNAVIVVDGRVKGLLEKAAERAKANRRRTIMPQDI